MSSKHYLNNDEFEQCIIAYKREPKKHEEEIVYFIDLLILNIYKTYKFQIDYDDARQECFIVALRAIRNFNPTKGSAFNYFTTLVFNTFRSQYKKEDKYTTKLNEYIEKVKEETDFDPHGNGLYT